MGSVSRPHFFAVSCCIWMAKSTLPACVFLTEDMQEKAGILPCPLRNALTRALLVPHRRNSCLQHFLSFSRFFRKFFVRTRLKSSQKKRCEGQYDELQCCSKGAFAVLPKSSLFFKPCKTSLYDPPFGNNCKCMQFIAFDYLYRYPLS